MFPYNKQWLDQFKLKLDSIPADSPVWNDCQKPDNWETDLGFLIKRIKEQDDYIAGLFQSNKYPADRLNELIDSAIKQRSYFAEKSQRVKDELKQGNK